MAPSRVSDDPPTMAPESRKRSAEPNDDQPPAKRKREMPSSVILAIAPPEESPCSIDLATSEELARKAMRRSLSLVLQKVGFDSATPDAMESFVSMTEIYLEKLIENVKAVTNAARRTHPTPMDFEFSLQRFNLTTSSLQPHKKPPIPRSRRIPTWTTLDIDDSVTADLPILGDELDGAPDKDAKEYIPSTFPAFPSIHTFKHTPESIDAVTVLKEPPPPTVEANGTLHQPKVEWPLAPNEIPHGDPKKMREAAAKEAKAGEEALRKLMRASKVASQKESWASAQRQPARRERYDLWESAMRELIEEDAKAKGQEIAPAEMHGEKGREGIADHSMIVNAELARHRREIVRAGSRKPALPAEGISSKV